MGYRVKKEFLKFEALTTLVDGVRVSLIKEYTHTTAATVTSPPKTITVPLATQAQLKAIFDRGDPCVEQFEEEKKPEIRNTLADYTPKNPFSGVTADLLADAQGKKKEVKNEPK